MSLDVSLIESKLQCVAPPHLQGILRVVGGVSGRVAPIAGGNVRGQLARHRRNGNRPGVCLYGGDPPLRVPRRGVAVPRRHGRRRAPVRGPVLRRRRRVREAGDGVLRGPPGGLPDAAAGARLGREVDADVHEHHDAGGDVEGAEGGVQDVAELLAELEEREKS